MMRSSALGSLLVLCLCLGLLLSGCQSDLTSLVNTGTKTVPPVFNPMPGNFSGSLDIALSVADTGATIYYTLDATNPSNIHGQAYSGPIHLTATTTITAIAYRTGMLPSDIIQSTYTLIGTPSTDPGDNETTTYTITTAKTGHGSLLLSPYQTAYAAGSSVQVTAVPETGWALDHWEGDASGTANPVAIVADANKTVRAVFVQKSVPTIVILNPAITCTPLPAQDQSSATTVTCTVIDSGGTIQSVTADLSQLGGSDTQALTRGDANAWSWSGNLIPRSGGLKKITFTAIDTQGPTATASAYITVNAPHAPPIILNPKVAANTAFFNDVPVQITVSCDVTVTDGTITSVAADLTAIGGSASQTLTAGTDNHWKWQGVVTPTVTGTRTITITVTDSFNVTALATVTVSVGGVNVAAPAADVNPDVDNSTSLDNITVTWSVVALDVSNRRVRLLAVDGGSQARQLPDNLTSFAIPADNTSVSVSVSLALFPPGTYTLRAEVFETDNVTGNPVAIASGTAPGRIIVGSGYRGTYNLADMANALTRGYSPIDGTVFEGADPFNGAGYEVAGLGDLDGDGCGDFVVFSRYAGNAGDGYVIYGRPDISQIKDLYQQQAALVRNMCVLSLGRIRNHVIPSMDNSTRLLFPMENLAYDNGSGYTFGRFDAKGMVDVSGDERGDLWINAPEAKPLLIDYVYMFDNGTPSADLFVTSNGGFPPATPADVPPALVASAVAAHSQYTLTPDHYGLARLLDMNAAPYMESAHLLTDFSIGTSHFVWGAAVPPPALGILPGDQIHVEVHLQLTFNATAYDNNTGVYTWDTNPKVAYDFSKVAVIPQANPNRGAAFLLTSDQLRAHRGGIYDLAYAGHPTQEGASDAPNGLTAPLYLPRIRTDADSRSQTFFMNSGSGPTFVAFDNFSLSVIPSITAQSGLDFALLNRTQSGVDYANPVQTPRTESGLVNVMDCHSRFTSVSSLVANIAWAWPGVAVHEYLEGPGGTTQPKVIDIIGPEDNSTIADVTSLGTYLTPNRRSGYGTTDFNDDRESEFVVSTPKSNSGNGEIYIFSVDSRNWPAYRSALIDLANFNQTQGLIPLDNGTLEVQVAGIKIQGSAATPIGNGIVAAGNFNDDKGPDFNTDLADFVIPMPEADNNTGEVIIVFGEKALGDTNHPLTCSIGDVNSGQTAAIKALVIKGNRPGDRFGAKIVCAGDVNGDGCDDLLITAPNAGTSDNASSNRGNVYLLYGKRNIIKAVTGSASRFVDYDGDGLADAACTIGDLVAKRQAVTFVGESDNFNLSAVASAGDVNGDGLADFLIGSPNGTVNYGGTSKSECGRAYLILGRPYTLPHP